MCANKGCQECQLGIPGAPDCQKEEQDDPRTPEPGIMSIEEYANFMLLCRPMREDKECADQHAKREIFKVLAFCPIDDHQDGIQHWPWHQQRFAWMRTIIVSHVARPQAPQYHPRQADDYQLHPLLLRSS